LAHLCIKKCVANGSLDKSGVKFLSAFVELFCVFSHNDALGSLWSSVVSFC